MAEINQIVLGKAPTHCLSLRHAYSNNYDTQQHKAHLHYVQQTRRTMHGRGQTTFEPIQEIFWLKYRPVRLRRISRKMDSNDTITVLSLPMVRAYFRLGIKHELLSILRVHNEMHTDSAL